MTALYYSLFVGTVHVGYFIGLMLFARQMPASLVNIAWIWGMGISLPFFAILDGVRWSHVTGNLPVFFGFTLFAMTFGASANYLLGKASVLSVETASSVSGVSTIALIPVVLLLGYRYWPEIFESQTISPFKLAGIGLAAVAIFFIVYDKQLTALFAGTKVVLQSR